MKYIEPKPRLSAFTCPHCQAISFQEWRQCGLDLNTYAEPRKISSELGKAFQQDNNPLKVGKCAHCGKQTIWLGGLLLYPNTGHAPAANEDLSLDVKKLYAEAASIVRLSPRAASALLRLAVETMCLELGQKRGNMNAMIQSLVDEGKVAKKIQMALDTVRITGNDAVHPGEIDDADDLESVLVIFDLINAIASHAITEPRMIDTVYAKLPMEKRAKIEEREKKAIKP